MQCCHDANVQNILEHRRVGELARRRRSDYAAPASQSETRSFATLMYQLNWVGKEARPEVVGVGSLLASHVANPTIAHILVANWAVALLLGTGSHYLFIFSQEGALELKLHGSTRRLFHVGW